MNLPELYRLLALGELTNLAMAVDSTILEEERAKIVLHANEGLKRLYTRFLLKESDLYLDQRGHLTTYSLTSKYAQSNYNGSAGHSFYINDLGAPFEDDVLKVLSVWNRLGEEVPLNQAHLWHSVFTPQPTVLQIPHPGEGKPLTVHYQAAHPKLSVDDPQANVELPEFLVGALTKFIAAEVYSNMNTQESTVKAGEFSSKFESICVDAIALDLVSTGGSTSGIRFIKNGWV